jgi:transposase
VFAAIVHDLRMLLRAISDRVPQPRAAIFDRRTVQSSPERGAQAGYGGVWRRRGSNVHIAGETLGHLLALLVTPAHDQDRGQVAAVATQVPPATGETVAVACVDPGSTGDYPADAAAAHGIRREVVQVPTPTRGCVLLPRRWGVERSVAWTTRLRRLVRDDERLPETLAGLHFLAFAIVLLKRFVTFMVESA